MTGVRRSVAHAVLGEEGVVEESVSTAVRGMRAMLVERPARIAGFALCLVWVFVASHSLSISISFAFAEGLSARILLLAGTSLGALAAYLLRRRGAGGGFGAVAIASLCMSAGFLLYAFPREMDVPELVSLCCVFASGVGYGYVFLSWLSLLEESKPAHSLATFGCSILLASAFDVVALAIPLYVLLAIMPCLPIASALLYLREAGAARIPVAEQRPNPARKGRTLRQKAAILFMIPLIIEGFAYGSFLQLTFNLNSTLENTVGTAALALAAVLLLLTSILYARLEKSGPLFVLFSILALGYALIPLFLKDVRVIIFILMLGYNFFYFFALALCADMRKAAGVSLLSCVVAVVLSFEIGNVAGSLFLVTFFDAIDVDSFRIVVSSAVVYSLLVGAFAAIQYLAKGRGDAREAAADERREARFCERYGLSHREQDVFALLAKGRTAAVIAEKLFISSETVRVHIKSIYRKVDVHSQQDLIDRFERDSETEDRLVE